MIIYLALLFPILLTIILFIYFKDKTQKWEIIIPFVGITLFILIAKWICISSLTDDIEYLGGLVTEVRYYEDWDEEVSCRHPIYCKSCSGTGKNKTCSEYVCGHRHMYDIDYHPKYWEAITTLSDYSISQEKYNQLIHKFEAIPKFHNMNRTYHSINGDMYFGKWDNRNKTLEPVAREHSYENRPRASHSIYHYEEVDTIDLKVYKPFEYPVIYNSFHQNVILGYNDHKAEQALQVINSRLGASKQIRIFLLVFKNQEKDAALIQERYWEGGNKNELNICVGIDNEKNIKWGHVFSWTEEEEVKINIRTYIEEAKTFNLIEIISVIDNEVKTNWKRKDFKEFNYLSIDPTTTQTVVIFILAFILTGGIGIWIVLNEFED